MFRIAHRQVRGDGACHLVDARTHTFVVLVVLFRAASRWLWARFRPEGVIAGLAFDLTRSHTELLAENAALRRQLILFRRQVKRPELHPFDRFMLLVHAAFTRTWHTTMIIVKPDTLIRWHRQGWRLLWRRKSRRAAFKPRVHPDTVALIRRMARDNRLWGAERIRGELLKLGIHLSKRTVQKYMRGARRPSPPGQSWRTFLRNHTAHIWACDFVQTFDIWFRPIFAFLIIGHGKRAAIHVGVTYHPTSEWVGQQLREATPFGRAPRFIIRDNDSKYGVDFDRVAATTGIRVLHTPIRGPDANAICERFIGSVRRECLDHVLVLGERHMLAVLRQYVLYFNEQRPHQGLGQRVPRGGDPVRRRDRPGSVRATPVLGGLHHSYACADG